MDNSFMLLLWGAVFILSVLAEMATMQLVSIWFTVGALAAFIAAVCKTSLVTQCILFGVLSAVLLIFTRPLVRRFFSVKVENTNAQELGRVGIVIQTIDARHGTGRVRVDGVDWNAVSSDATVIEKDASVRIEEKSGTKLTVRRLQEEGV